MASKRAKSVEFLVYGDGVCGNGGYGGNGEEINGGAEIKE